MKEKYIELLTEILIKINEIDTETLWQEVEPEWWLQMMELRRQVYHNKKALKS